MQFMLDLVIYLPPMQARQKMEKVKAYFSASQNPINSSQEAARDTIGSSK